jgi:hypothetical protein
MATKSETARARAERERWGSKGKKKSKSKRQATAAARARTDREAAQYSSGRYAGGVTAWRNVKVDRAEHETRDLEDSGSGRPSRKSTRKGANRVKPDTQLRQRAVRRSRSPRARARRARAAAKRG